MFVEIVKYKRAVECVLPRELGREKGVKLAENGDMRIDDDVVMDLRIGVWDFTLEVVCLALDVLACKATLASDPSVSNSSSEAEVVFDTSNLLSSSILSSSTYSSPLSTLGLMIEGCRRDGVRDSREMMEDDEGINFESGWSFISIGLPARTLVAIRLAGDILVELAWREGETVLVLAAEDRDVVLRATERIELAEEPLMFILFAISLSASTLKLWGWLEIGLRRRPI